MDGKKVDADIAGIKRRSARGAFAMLASQGCKFVLQFASIAALGRLLTPSDFGLVAMVAPVAAFIMMFNELGLTQATIQRQHISQGQMTALFWIAVGFSCLLGLSTYLLAPFVGWFYGEPRAAPLTVAYGSLLIFSGLSVQHLAILNRDLRFGALAALEVAALATGIASGISVAWIFHSYWAIIVAQGVTAATTAAFAWTISGWRPGLPRRADDVAGLLRFGGNLTGFNIVNFFARNLDNVLIGKVWGRTDLGLYDQAYKLLMLPLNQISYPISRIAIPILSRLVLEPERYRSAYLQILEKVLLVAVPGVTFLVVEADKVVLLLLGPKWSGVAPIFHWLGTGALPGLIGNSTGWLFISQNRTGEMFRWGLLSSSLLIISFFIGLPFGPVGVAMSYVLVGNLVQAPLLFWAVTREGPVRLGDIWETILTFAAASGASAATVYGLALVAGPSAIAVTLACLPVSYLAAIGFLALVPRGRKMLVDMIDVAALLARP